MTVEEALLPDVIENPPQPAAPLSLFGNDPRLALERMAEIASALMDVIESKHLYATINGRRHITAEGWTCLAGMVGVTPVIAWSRPTEDGEGWEARCEVRTFDGRTIGAGESMCSSSERTWKSRDGFAIRGMAQTRSLVRALRLTLSPLAHMAGYEPSAAEEIPQEPRPASPISPGPTILQKQRMNVLLQQLQEAAPGVDWPEHCRRAAGVPSAGLTATRAEDVIEQMQAWLVELEGQADDEA